MTLAPDRQPVLLVPPRPPTPLRAPQTDRPDREE